MWREPIAESLALFADTSRDSDHMLGMAEARNLLALLFQRAAHTLRLLKQSCHENNAVFAVCRR